MRKSKIFTNKELDIIELKEKDQYKDRTGRFASRIKPKIIELIEWAKDTKRLKKLIETKVK